METSVNALELLYPTGKTVLMQHLQTLVLRGNPYWVGGVIAPEKLAGLIQKLAARYPVTRTERGRIYDRTRGLAVAHVLVYPTLGGVAWWVLCSEGKGGLADPLCADFKAAKHAMKSGQHISFDDYELVYATKRDVRTIKDGKTGKEKNIAKELSTWTWRISRHCINEVRAVLDHEVRTLNYGDHPRNGKAGYGVRGTLYYQRQRPLFSGVRTQVIELHREASDAWGGVRNRWIGIYTELARTYGDKAGQLIPISELVTAHLPKMTRFKVFTDPIKTIRSLTVSK